MKYIKKAVSRILMVPSKIIAGIGIVVGIAVASYRLGYEDGVHDVLNTLSKWGKL